jgi:very-short-patch-repair endonuclease
MRRCLGYRFRRQSIILGWIADFWCPELRFVVEVDGRSHDSRHIEDRYRDEVMAQAAISVLRIPAALVERDLDRAVREIEETIRIINNEVRRAI